MAVYNDTDLVQITCDGRDNRGRGCTESIEAYNFDDALDHMKRDAWYYTKEPISGWVHFCPRCKPKPPKPDVKKIFGGL